MFGAGWMNLTSLGLGLAAWALPLAALALRKRAAGRLCPALVWASAAACGAALYLQICYQNHLVQIHDVGAILDTTDALVFVAGVLLAVGCLCAGRLGHRKGEKRRRCLTQRAFAGTMLLHHRKRSEKT